MPILNKYGDIMQDASTLKLTRREFLKLTGLVTGALLLERYGLETFAKTKPQQALSETGIKWAANICNLCSTNCDIIVAYKEINGKKIALKIEGDPESGYNLGKICARGQAGLRRVYSPQRLKKPLIRTGPKGTWAFREATWDEVRELIKNKIQELTGGDFTKIGFVSGWPDCTSYRPFAFSFLKAIGMKYFTATPIQHCVLAAHLGVDSVTGTFNAHAEIVPDYGNSDFILAVRANASITGVSVPRGVRFAEALKRAAENGARIVVLDPRLSETAALATDWIPIKPGTDPAFLLAMINVLVAENLVDTEFLKKHTNAPFLAKWNSELKVPELVTYTENGNEYYAVYDTTTSSVKYVSKHSNENTVDKDGVTINPALEAPSNLQIDGVSVKTIYQYLKEKIAEYTPEWASQITDVSADKIREIARAFGNAQRPVVDHGWYGGRYGNSFMVNKLKAMLMAFKGRIDKEGGWIFTAKNRPAVMRWNAAGAPRSPDAPRPGLVNLYNVMKGNVWSLPDDQKPPAMWPFATDLAMYPAVKNGALKVLLLFSSNPLKSMAPREIWEYILSNTFVISLDIQATETHLYADVIIPELSYLERIDAPMPTEAPGIEFAARFPAADPISDELEHSLTSLSKLLDILTEIDGTKNYRAIWYNIIKVMFGMDDEEKAKFDEFLKVDTPPEEVPEKMQRFFAWMFFIHRLRACGKVGKTCVDPESEIIDAFLERLKMGSLELKTTEEILAEGSGMREPYDLQVPTISGRIELFSEAIYEGYKAFANKLGYSPMWDPLLAYPKPEWKNGKEDTWKPQGNEFFVTHGKTPLMSFSSTTNNDLLLSLNTVEKRYMWVWIHPNRANALGIKTGDKIKITETKSGENKFIIARAYVTDGIREDTIYIPFGWTGEPKVQEYYKKFWEQYGPLPEFNKLMPNQRGNVTAEYRSDEFTVIVEKL